MGTIVERRRKDGSRAYTAQIRIMRDGVKVHTEAQTFDRRPAASAWLKKRETQLAAPGALEALNAPQVTLADAINKYLDTSMRKIGRTKAQVLETILRHPLAARSCDTITSADVSAFARELQGGWTPEGGIKPRQPQTVGNYMSHLGAVFAVARPMWGYPLEQQVFRDAQVVTGRMGIISKSASRNRRPELQELDKLLTFFTERRKRAPQAMPMDQVILFALFSTRRQEEITLLRWEDYEPKNARILVRDMKHPGQKVGNDVWCDMPLEAMAVIERMPRDDERIFPYSTSATTANFTRACKVLGIEDLRFHDLRHEGVTRLFEIGLSIPHVAAVSGHRSWSSLKRYTHLRQVGDKYVDWQWKPKAQ
ncbi:site-specific integrase [Rhizobium sp. CSW-27]|uniref:site-specific integrase n=1 Tax=Rhizobium sp. CSW-27 TaxID=2839985 RepID=UPI001C017CBF|nr:site-specific integrase [Rhizobium sp. CSW-27]MBT9373121.1 site-specific integrase [Rhizobium sp. CSW-27]